MNSQTERLATTTIIANKGNNNQELQICHSTIFTPIFFIAGHTYVWAAQAEKEERQSNPALPVVWVAFLGGVVLTWND